MPKRARVDEADGAPEALARATKAAINKHGWDELRLAYRTGRLRFMEGVGAKATAEITLFLQASAAERSHWQRFMDLVGPHLNSDWMKRLASWSNSGIVNDSLVKQVQTICTLTAVRKHSAAPGVYKRGRQESPRVRRDWPGAVLAHLRNR